MIGALVPVVPTGALVSSAAVVAFHQTTPLAMVLVFAVASLAAFLGDVALYWLGRRGMGSKNGSRWLAAIRNRAPEDRLARAQGKLSEHGVAVLVLSRLVPAGRIPVMLACLMAKWPVRRFARGDVPACLVWAATYQLIGVLGGSLFDEPWQGVVAAVALTLTISAAPSAWRRIRGLREAA
ncbi:MAG: VTT domain-containing protein [Streptomyces turgidiscabies]|nr:VTT domain-containing protein [Streptomyces turgidiscabies]